MNDQLTRIEKLLERIAVALEKHGEPDVIKSASDKSWEDFISSESIKFRRDARGYVIKPEGTQTEMVKSDVKCTDWSKQAE